MSLGTSPRVLALSNGNGIPGRDAVCWVFLEHDGRVLENGKFVDLKVGNPEKFIPDGKDINALVELIQRRKPDVIGVSGFSVETRRLYKDLQEIVDKNDLRTIDDEDENEEAGSKIEVVMVNDEVARLYHTSERAAAEFPQLASVARYCVALARYLRNPLLEYASLGNDINSISFDPDQDLVPSDKLLRHLETAIVDMVNLVGVDLEEAINDTYVANLLPYVCGLGPRKAARLLNVIGHNVSWLLSSTRSALMISRAELSTRALNFSVMKMLASLKLWGQKSGTIVLVSFTCLTRRTSRILIIWITPESILKIMKLLGKSLPTPWTWTKKMSRQRQMKVDPVLLSDVWSRRMNKSRTKTGSTILC